MDWGERDADPVPRKLGIGALALVPWHCSSFYRVDYDECVIERQKNRNHLLVLSNRSRNLGAITCETYVLYGLQHEP